MKMLWHIYLRKGQVFIPTVARTDAGYFMDVDPVTVHALGDTQALITSIASTIARGNPIVPAPSRANFPKPVVLKHANVKSWSAFAKAASCWEITPKDSSYEICPTREHPEGGWEDDTARMQVLPRESTPEQVARRLVELVQSEPPSQNQ